MIPTIRGASHPWGGVSLQ